MAGLSLTQGTGSLIEATLVSYRKLLGQIPGGELHDGPDLKWSWTGHSHLNMVFASRLKTVDISDRINQLKTYFCQRHITYVNWLLGPSSQPHDLDLQLVREHGAHPLDGQASVQLTGMILDMNELVSASPPVQDIAIEVVQELNNLSTWLDLAFDHPVRRKVMHQLIQTYGFSDTPQVSAYLCHLRNKPVGTALIYEGTHAILLRSVYVQESARGQGIGRWISWYALEACRHHGHRLAVTDATDAGAVVYHKLGFKKSCPLYEYAVRIGE